LDLHASLAIRNYIKNLAGKENKTIILTTHQMDIAQELSNRVVIMKRGRIIKDDSIKNLLEIFKIKEFDFIINGHNNFEVIRALDYVTVEQKEDDIYIKATINEDTQLYHLVRLLEEGNAKIKSINENTNLARIFVNLTKRKESLENA
jgi:ABC-2 type transport system ATP-binding protein